MNDFGYILLSTQISLIAEPSPPIKLFSSKVITPEYFSKIFDIVSKSIDFSYAHYKYLKKFLFFRIFAALIATLVTPPEHNIAISLPSLIFLIFPYSNLVFRFNS